jgi:tetratricopeptide (TPR) repeat protein
MEFPMKRAALLLLAVVSLFAVFVLADEDHHHEDLTAEQLGTVHFPVSCTASSQKAFERGVALLHSFWYEEAEKEFVQIAKDDPTCAMAHWGVAMSLWHQLWDHPNAATTKRGMAELKKARSLHPATARERDYIAALRAFYQKNGTHDERATVYSQAMEGVYHRYPDDREAAAFYALSLLASEPDGDSTFANRKKAAAVLETLFKEEPNHPGVAHYLIHSYDKPQLAELGLPAARSYAKIAPAAPHALHMPSHIFARLGLWQDDIDSNLASIAATRKTAAMHMGGEGHQFHAMDFLVYAYLQSGHEADAQRVIEEVKALPPMKDMYGMGYDPRVYALSRFPALYALELHHWTEAAALAPAPGADSGDKSITYWARAIGAARSGNVAEARKDIAELESMRQEMLKDKKTSWAQVVEGSEKEAGAWVAHAEGKDEDAIKTLRAMAEQEESTGDEPEDIPAREMLADLLLEAKHPEQALAEYETDLKFSPNRFNGLYGAASAAELAGKSEKASTYYAQLVKICAGSNSDRPELGRAKALLAKN